MGKRTASNAEQGVTLDAGALIALERGSGRMVALLAEVARRRCTVRVPAGVVGQVWRSNPRQFHVRRLLNADEVDVVPLDDRLARACGELCGATETDDVIDASVVLVARRYGDPIVTGDPSDLRRLAPTAAIETV